MQGNLLLGGLKEMWKCTVSVDASSNVQKKNNLIQGIRCFREIHYNYSFATYSKFRSRRD